MDKGVNLRVSGAGSSLFERDGKGMKVESHLQERMMSISADIVVLSIGVRPETTLACHAGQIGEAGGIAVNDYSTANAGRIDLRHR